MSIHNFQLVRFCLAQQRPMAQRPRPYSIIPISEFGDVTYHSGSQNPVTTIAHTSIYTPEHKSNPTRSTADPYKRKHLGPEMSLQTNDIKVCVIHGVPQLRIQNLRKDWTDEDKYECTLARIRNSQISSVTSANAPTMQPATFVRQPTMIPDTNSANPKMIPRSQHTKMKTATDSSRCTFVSTTSGIGMTDFDSISLFMAAIGLVLFPGLGRVQSTTVSL